MTAFVRSTSTATSCPRVSRLLREKVSRCGIWSDVCVPGMNSIAPLARLLGVNATQAVTTSGLLRPQYVESWCQETNAGLFASLMKKFVVQHRRSGPYNCETA